MSQETKKIHNYLKNILKAINFRLGEEKNVISTHLRLQQILASTNQTNKELTPLNLIQNVSRLTVSKT